MVKIIRRNVKPILTARQESGIQGHCKRYKRTLTQVDLNSGSHCVSLGEGASCLQCELINHWPMLQQAPWWGMSWHTVPADGSRRILPAHKGHFFLESVWLFTRLRWLDSIDDLVIMWLRIANLVSKINHFFLCTWTAGIIKQYFDHFSIKIYGENTEFRVKIFFLKSGCSFSSY